MTEEYKFFDSTSDDIREYSAGDFANYWGSIYTSGLLFEQNTLALQVTTNGSLTTKVGSGKALIKGHAYENTESLIMVHNPSSGGRIDRVVLRMDLGFNQRYIRLFVKEGTASAPPSLTRTEQIYELSLAQVKVRAGASSITASDITDERLNEEVCGPVVALVSAMAFSYPSDVPSDITYIKDKVTNLSDDVVNLKNQIENIQNEVKKNSIFGRSTKIKRMHYDNEVIVNGEGILIGVIVDVSSVAVVNLDDETTDLRIYPASPSNVNYGVGNIFQSINAPFQSYMKVESEGGGILTVVYAI